jgi:hypothetical protein
MTIICFVIRNEHMGKELLVTTYGINICPHQTSNSEVFESLVLHRGVYSDKTCSPNLQCHEVTTSAASRLVCPVVNIQRPWWTMKHSCCPLDLGLILRVCVYVQPAASRKFTRQQSATGWFLHSHTSASAPHGRWCEALVPNLGTHRR